MKTTGTIIGFVVAVALMVGMAAPAGASSPVYRYSTEPSTTQAGGHPDMVVEYKVGNRAVQGFNDPCFCNDPKTIIQGYPQGVIGNPHSTPRCDAAEFSQFRCPSDSQVGVIALLLYKEIGSTGGIWIYAPLYNMVPRPDQAGLLAFPAPTPIDMPQYAVVKARTGGDFGLDISVIGAQRLFPVFGVAQYLWGVPADPIHDPLRFLANGTNPGGLCFSPTEHGDPREALEENRFPSEYEECNRPSPPTVSSNSPRIPYLSNPTDCGSVLTSTLFTESYDLGTEVGEATYPEMTGCDLLSFNPSLSAKPTTEEADSASGVDIDLTVPQQLSPETPSPSAIKATTVTLPEGFSINPNAADGKLSCSDVDAMFGTEEAARCPEFSKVGTLELESSALPGPIGGSIYLGDPKPGDRYRIILAANGFATHIKLLGSIVPDPGTGRLVAKFEDLPMSPLTRFRMHFFGSERGLLATPKGCGTYPVHSTFTPWDSALPDQSATQFFTIDAGASGSPCPSKPRPFAPSFTAASAGNTAGAHSSFAVQVQRPDGDQNLAGLEVSTPPGFSASLRGVPYCPDPAIGMLVGLNYGGRAEQASSACPPASQIGTAVAGAGAGSRPFYTSGKVYLAGPYKGAPLSLVVVIPAVAGPYDLGNVAVRAAVHVDPVTARVTTISDPLPQILEGIPLRTRSIQVNLNRPNFALNPTNCDPFAVTGTVTGDEGASHPVGSPFQIANCAILDYKPKIRLRLSGNMKRRGHPAIRATLSTRPGEANTGRVAVTLPRSGLLDNSHIGTVCTRVDFATDACPAKSVIGNARATTPLLDQPLTGQVYLRSSSHRLPDMVVDLEGQIDVELAGRVDAVNGRLRTIFASVPDAPISKFVLNLKGGSKGLLINSESLCGKPKRATVKMTGQNGARVNRRVRLSLGCRSRQRQRRDLHHGRPGGVR